MCSASIPNCSVRELSRLEENLPLGGVAYEACLFKSFSSVEAPPKGAGGGWSSIHYRKRKIVFFFSRNFDV